MRALVAPDKFKGCLTAAEAAGAIAEGLTDAGARTRCLPLADGGDGTLEACLQSGFRRLPIEVSGPTGERVEASVGFDGTTAVVELADTCGLARLPYGRRAPMTSSTLGLGEAIRAALDLGPDRIVVGLGGSASTDGGVGLLSALGASFTDANGAPLALGGGALTRLARVDLEPARAALEGIELVGATDVTMPLTGADGAAYVFAPQKGADPEQVRALDVGLTRLADLARLPADLAGAGAAGGAGYGLLLLGATLVSGADFVLDLLGFDDALADADVVVTGEGRIDDPSFSGKLVGTIVERARRAGVPAVAVVGTDGRSRPDVGGVPVLALDVIAGRSTAGDRRGALVALREAGRAVPGLVAPAVPA